MKIPEATICTVCKKFFCCEKCRKKHETKVHAIIVKSQHHHTGSKVNESSEAIYVLCPICSNKPFPLKELIYDEVLEHIKEHHLPLHCQKCDKIYTKIEELSEFSKCIQRKLTFEKEDCTTKTIDEIEAIETCEQRTDLKTISTQTSPMLAVGTTAPLTPISIINLRWHVKTNKATHEISDSVSSIKNLSSMSNTSYNRRSIGTVVQFETKGKLVRTTSTPVHAEAEYMKPRAQNFNASNGQVSSIYNSGCDVENEKHTPASSQTAALQTDKQDNIFRKLGGRPKVAAVTPLRQVMSKSIQKAFAEQKKLVQETATALSNSPLDLRLSPALRRSQSDSFCVVHPKNQTNFKASSPKATILKTQKCKISTEQKTTTTTNAIVITCYETTNEIKNSESIFESNSNSTSNSVYKTCQSIEIITSTESSKVDLSENIECNTEKNPNHLEAINTPITRLPGAAVNKKLIKFETPNMKNDTKNETFHTPLDTPAEYDDIILKSKIKRELSKCSPLCRPSIRECAQSTAYSHYEVVDEDYSDVDDDEVFLTPTQEKRNKNIETTDQAIQHGNGVIWSFMSSVLKKGTEFLDKKSTNQKDTEKLHKTSIIKRCASIAGSLVRSNSLLDERQTLKRKRTNTFDGQTSPLQALRRLDSLPQHLDYFSSTKRFRIHGRKPIDRMRNTTLT